MQVSVLIEPLNGRGYRARGGEPFGISAEGVTRDEALAKLQAALETRLRDGAEVVTLEVGSEAKPWMKFAGIFKDDPYFTEVAEIIAENRRAMDNDPNIP
jgi:predicted RNase H-like HicB family nuclease